MVISIPNYHLGSRVVSLALSAEGFEILKGQNLSCVYLWNDSLEIFPDGVNLPLDSGTIEQLLQCYEYDIFVITDDGNMRMCYDNETCDNLILVTQHCNSNCIMCPTADYVRRYGDSYSVDTQLEIIKHIQPNTGHLTLTGGEPFMIGERLFELLAALKERAPYADYQLLTNGRALAYSVFAKKFVETSPERMQLGIPLHGYNAETHDAIVRAPGAFKQTMMGIKHLLQERYDVELRIVVSKLNYQFITQIAELIIREIPDVFRVVIMGLEMLGNAAVNKEQVWITYREAFEASKEAIDLLARHSIITRLYNFPLCSIDQEYYQIADKSISGYKIKFPEECSGCSLQSMCGGIFAGTMRLAGADVKPVISNV